MSYTSTFGVVLVPAEDDKEGYLVPVVNGDPVPGAKFHLTDAGKRKAAKFLADRVVLEAAACEMPIGVKLVAAYQATAIKEYGEPVNTASLDALFSGDDE